MAIWQVWTQCGAQIGAIRAPDEEGAKERAREKYPKWAEHGLYLYNEKRGYVIRFKPVSGWFKNTPLVVDPWKE